MSRRNTARAFATGVLAANALPHAYAASTGATHLTPLRGRASGPATNALWAAMNAGAAVVLARGGPHDTSARRGFKLGVVAFSAWALVSERIAGLD